MQLPDQPAPLIVFIDTETTDLSPAKGALISIAAICVGGLSDGESIVLKCRPHASAYVSPHALAANGYKLGEIQSWSCPVETAATFTQWITDRLSPGELCQPAGWNYDFDDRFMRAWLATNHNQTWYGNTFSDEPLDVMKEFSTHYKDFKSDPRFGNKKLTTAYKGIFGKDLQDAHTEYADARATAEVFFHLAKETAKPHWSKYLESTLSPYKL